LVVDQLDKCRLLPQMHDSKELNNSEDFIRFYEPRPYRLRRLAYQTEQLRAHNDQTIQRNYYKPICFRRSMYGLIDYCC
jgi:hypothetical protein